MDKKRIEEIKQRNKKKMNQWEDKLKIGKIAPQQGDSNKAEQEEKSVSKAFSKISEKNKQQQIKKSPEKNKPQNSERKTNKQKVPPKTRQKAAQFDIGPVNFTKENAPQKTKQKTKHEKKAPARKAPARKKAAKTVSKSDKYMHIDILNGKIKLKRKNMSVKETLSILAKVYKSYKNKLK